MLRSKAMYMMIIVLGDDCFTPGIVNCLQSIYFMFSQFLNLPANQN
jgi:hypothetical protein